MESLILLEARPCVSEADTEIVAGVWDFERINRRYFGHLKVLAERPGGMSQSAICNLRSSEAWGEAWLDAVTNDPLLLG